MIGVQSPFALVILDHRNCVVQVFNLSNSRLEADELNFLNDMIEPYGMTAEIHEAEKENDYYRIYNSIRNMLKGKDKVSPFYRCNHEKPCCSNRSTCKLDRV